MHTRKTTLRFTTNQSEGLDELAKKTGMAKASLVRLAVEKFLKSGYEEVISA